MIRAVDPTRADGGGGSMLGPRVLQVVASLGLGGAERVALELAAGLPAEGIPSSLVCVGPTAGAPGPFERTVELEAVQRGVAVHRIGVQGVLDRAGWSGLANLLRRQRPDLVHIHNRPQDWQVATLCRGLGIAALYSVHSPYVLTRIRQRALYAATARLAAAVICVSRTVAEHIRRSEWVPKGKIHIIPNDILPEMLAPRPAGERARVRAELGWDDAAFGWICVARLGTEKGHLFLVEAMSRLPSTSRARLVLAGEGPARSEIEGAIALLGLADRVRLLGARSDVAALLRADDAYACASPREGHPLALVEARVAGLPLVAPRLASVLELVADEATVLFGPTVGPSAVRHDAAALSAALLEVEKRRDGYQARAAATRAQQFEEGRQRPPGHRGMRNQQRRGNAGGEQRAPLQPSADAVALIEHLVGGDTEQHA